MAFPGLWCRLLDAAWIESYQLIGQLVEADDVFRGVMVSLVCSMRGIVVVMTYRKREFVIVDGWAWNTLLRMPKLTPLPT